MTTGLIYGWIVMVLALFEMTSDWSMGQICFSMFYENRK